MSKSKVIAFIGTREWDDIPDETRSLYLLAAASAARTGYLLCTGAATGCDQKAAYTALVTGGRVELVLPWASYESQWVNDCIDAFPGKVDVTVYNPDEHPEWKQSVIDFHPAWHRLTQGPLALHARNFGIVFGATAVVALSSPTKPGGGGTGQGIRVAQALRIRLFDLANDEQAAALRQRLGIPKE